MFITYHRSGRSSLLFTLAAIPAGLIVVGVAAFALVALGVAACGLGLVRAAGRVLWHRRGPVDGDITIDGVVTHRSLN